MKDMQNLKAVADGKEEEIQKLDIAHEETMNTDGAEPKDAGKEGDKKDVKPPPMTEDEEIEKEHQEIDEKLLHKDPPKPPEDKKVEDTDQPFIRD